MGDKGGGGSAIKGKRTRRRKRADQKLGERVGYNKEGPRDGK